MNIITISTRCGVSSRALDYRKHVGGFGDSLEFGKLHITPL